MNRLDLPRTLAPRIGVTIAEAERIVGQLSEIIQLALVEGVPIVFKGGCSIVPSERSYQVRHPVTHATGYCTRRGVRVILHAAVRRQIPRGRPTWKNMASQQDQQVSTKPPPEPGAPSAPSAGKNPKPKTPTS